MQNNKKPKETSYEYGRSYQEQMVEYYIKSKEPSDRNTEYLRLVLANDLVNKYAIPRIQNKTIKDITVVDVGCSVGLFAIEFSKKGYKSIGIDFDPAALEIAQKLNSDEGTNAQFYRIDVSDWHLDHQIDIALCFDLFEHLHDDELGALLYGMKKHLSQNGSLVFHTLPMKYDYLFWNDFKAIIQFPWFLRPFRYLNAEAFKRLIRIYALWLDIVRLFVGKDTYKESIKMSGHCNPLTREKLEDILSRAGFEILFIETGFLGDVQLDQRDRRFFYKHTITHRSLRGVAVLKR